MSNNTHACIFDSIVHTELVTSAPVFAECYLVFQILDEYSLHLQLTYILTFNSCSAEYYINNPNVGY